MRRLALCFLLLATSTGWAATPPSRIVRVEYRLFPGLASMDGNWSALLAGSDGKVYVGLAYHGGDGHLVYYDPSAGAMHDVGALTVLCGSSFSHGLPVKDPHQVRRR